MLEREKPRFVVVGPRWLDGHKDMILACAEHGVLGIFCEKPLAPDLASCDAIVDACDRSHVKLAMAFQTRYSPRYERVKALIAEGAIGEVLELRGRGKEDRRGGGEDLMVLGVHILDLCHDLLGEPAWCFARVSERGRAVGPADVPAGRRGDRSAGGRPRRRHVRLPGDRGGRPFRDVAADGAGPAVRADDLRLEGLHLDGDRLEAARLHSARSHLDGHGLDGLVADHRRRRGRGAGGGHSDLAAGNRAIVADLIHAVETDTQPRTHARAARTAVEMVLACYASNGRGGTVALPLAERERPPATRSARESSR